MVTPKPRFSVTAAIAGISSSGSFAGRLRGVAQRRVRAVAEHVVDAEHVGEKQPVEPSALQRPGQIESSRAAGYSSAVRSRGWVHSPGD